MLLSQLIEKLKIKEDVEVEFIISTDKGRLVAMHVNAPRAKSMIKLLKTFSY